MNYQADADHDGWPIPSTMTVGSNERDKSSSYKSGNKLLCECDQSVPHNSGNELRLMLLYVISLVKYVIIVRKWQG